MKNQMPMSVTVAWQEKMQFVAKNTAGCTTIMDAGIPSGGTGDYPTPIEIFLSTLGGCSGIEIVKLLRSKGIEITSLEARIDGTRRQTRPTVFEKVHVIFTLSIERDDPVIIDAINEVMTAICPIAITFGRVADLTWEYRTV